jgi:hypothetical protein
MHEFIAFAQRSGFAFIHIILSCTQDVNIARLRSPERLAQKEQPQLGGGAGGRAINTDEGELIATRMEEEIGHIAPVKGLCGEFEIDTTRMSAATAAGVLAEYCLDTLRNQGWWIQLNSMPKPKARVQLGGKKMR